MKIQASHCKTCERAIVPPRETCPYCGLAERMVPVQLSNRGIVLSYTVLEMPTKGFYPPHLLALVKLDKGAVILALGEKGDVENVKIDAPVMISQDNENRFVLKLPK